MQYTGGGFAVNIWHAHFECIHIVCASNNPELKPINYWREIFYSESFIKLKINEWMITKSGLLKHKWILYDRKFHISLATICKFLKHEMQLQLSLVLELLLVVFLVCSVCSSSIVFFHPLKTELYSLIILHLSVLLML